MRTIKGVFPGFLRVLFTVLIGVMGFESVALGQG
jgi:hypothetical protein